MPSETNAPFGRILTAMATPFAQDGSIDLAAAGRLANDLIDLGNDGLIVNGTTGESPTTRDVEKAALVRAVKEAVGARGLIVAGAGSNDTSHSLELAAAAAGAGADGLLLVTPYYSKPTQSGLIQHLSAIADSQELPVMLYDIPGRSGVPLEHHTILRLGEHPRIVANKDAKGDLFAAQRVMAESDLAYYSGDDALNLPLLSVGAVGFVSVTGHLVADRLRAMLEAHERGQVERARDINTSLVPVTHGVMGRGPGVMMVKAALDLLGRPGGGQLRLPMMAAGPEQREQLRLDLKAGGFEL